MQKYDFFCTNATFFAKKALFLLFFLVCIEKMPTFVSSF